MAPETGFKSPAEIDAILLANQGNQLTPEEEEKRRLLEEIRRVQAAAAVEGRPTLAPEVISEADELISRLRERRQERAAMPGDPSMGGIPGVPPAGRGAMGGGIPGMPVDPRMGGMGGMGGMPAGRDPILRERMEVESELRRLRQPVEPTKGWEMIGDTLLGLGSRHRDAFLVQNQREAKRQKALDLMKERQGDLRQQQADLRQARIDEQARRQSEALIGQYEATTRKADLETDIKRMEWASPKEQELASNAFQLWQQQNPGRPVGEWLASQRGPTKPKLQVLDDRYVINIDDPANPKMVFDLRTMRPRLNLSPQPETITEGSDDPREGLYDKVDMWVTGPLGETAKVVGEVFGTLPAITGIRQEFEAAGNTLRMAFMEGRYLQGQADMIERELGNALDPKFWTNPIALRAKMEALDGFLVGREDFFHEVINSPETSDDRREEYIMGLRNMMEFRRLLNVPDVLSDEDLESEYEGISEEDMKAYIVSGSSLGIREWLASQQENNRIQ